MSKTYAHKCMICQEEYEEDRHMVEIAGGDVAICKVCWKQLPQTHRLIASLVLLIMDRSKMNIGFSDN